MKTFYISNNGMILKTFNAKRRPTLYILWWRQKLPKWPYTLDVKLPKKISGDTRPGWSMMGISGTALTVHPTNIEAIGYEFATDSEEELVIYLTNKEYPPELIEFFVKKW